MKKPLRRILAGLTLATATITGYALTEDSVTSPAGDTAWGAPDTTTVAAVDTPVHADISGLAVTPLDTAWG